MLRAASTTPVEENILFTITDLVLLDYFTVPELFNKKGNFYPIQVVETVAKCCPSLQEISFVLETPQLPRSAEALWAKSFAGLKKLVTLKLSWSSPFKLVPFFTHLGSSCPNLKQLKMRELFFGLHQQLALVLGPKAELLPHPLIRIYNISLY